MTQGKNVRPLVELIGLSLVSAYSYKCSSLARTAFGEMSAQVTLDKLSLYTTGPFGSIAAKKYARSNNFRVAQFGGVTG